MFSTGILVIWASLINILFLHQARRLLARCQTKIFTMGLHTSQGSGEVFGLLNSQTCKHHNHTVAHSLAAAARAYQLRMALLLLMSNHNPPHLTIIQLPYLFLSTLSPLCKKLVGHHILQLPIECFFSFVFWPTQFCRHHAQLEALFTGLPAQLMEKAVVLYVIVGFKIYFERPSWPRPDNRCIDFDAFYALLTFRFGGFWRMLCWLLRW